MKSKLKEELKRIHILTYGNINESLSNKITSINEVDDPKKADIITDELTDFYNTLITAAKSGGITQQINRSNRGYQKSVEALQIGLMLLGYELPRNGADGIFSHETAEAVRRFKNDFISNINEGADELRDTLRDLGHEEKGNELTSGGGDITDDLSTFVSNILKDFKLVKPNVKVKITAGNDNYHKGLSYNSKHKVGKAVDLVIIPHNVDTSNAFTEILNNYKSKDSKFDFIDEYKHPSKAATGGHFHLQYGGGSALQNKPSGVSQPIKSLINKPEVATPEMLIRMVGILKQNELTSEDLDVYVDKTLFVKGVTDENFYKQLLIYLRAPVTKENLKFLYAWRESEGKGGRYNPFNTTFSISGSTNYNKHGVKNYSSAQEGLIATIRTLTNGKYNCILNGLRKNLGARTIASCRGDLKTWGTGDLVSKVVNRYDSGEKPKIIRLA
jgi:hypothetical protein